MKNIKNILQLCDTIVTFNVILSRHKREEVQSYFIKHVDKGHAEPTPLPSPPQPFDYNRKKNRYLNFSSG